MKKKKKKMKRNEDDLYCSFIKKSELLKKKKKRKKLRNKIATSELKTLKAEIIFLFILKFIVRIEQVQLS
jgi:hypothetical protein